jgi:hypothetical protein
MQFTLTDSLLNQLIKLKTFDKSLSTALAADLLDLKEPLSMAQFLLTREVALELLAGKLMEAPARTLRTLEAMPDRTAGPPRRRPGKQSRRAKRTKAPRSRVTRAKAKQSSNKRIRLTPGQTEKLKERIQAFLRANPGSSRKEILRAAKIPTEAVYNRVMGELREAGVVTVKGERRFARYFPR